MRGKMSSGILLPVDTHLPIPLALEAYLLSMQTTLKGTAHNNTHGSSLGFPSSNRSSPPEYVRQLMRISQTILMRLEQLGRQVDAMQQHLFNTTVRLQDETNDDVVLTPVKDIDQFLSLEGRLAADGNIKLKLIQQLAGLGGSTFGAAARRMLELLLSLEVAVQFSWAGQKGKRKFVDLGVTDVICKAVRRNFPETKKNDIECVIKVWLRHAGEKLQKQRLRTSRTHHEECLQSVALSSPSDEDL
ncbi:uncharacterized protein LOC142776661 isoform X4 [Rhipicephalus microplus]|uniref:uncharacterized protein LOC142776661 isoform X4 n=1 Tax=Rhipicephalus microplus TaxID=6941 RepID=UPI00188715F9|nr:uncharacterized protein LOC119164476 isoform X1 [Rhipicephalus microplus]